MWLNLFVNSVHDITFNTRAFETLVLPAKQKELVLGFTATQQAYRNAYDDVIEGKGRGIIILLCGPPGVGKTLTAESVAEEMKVPLFVMSAGDLGMDSRTIEARLLAILSMVSRSVSQSQYPLTATNNTTKMERHPPPRRSRRLPREARSARHPP